jgi:hypothetical protein
VTLHELLARALVLAGHGFLGAVEVKERAASVAKAEKELAEKAEALKEYEAEALAALGKIDNRLLTRLRWERLHDLAVMVRSEMRLLNEALADMQNELEQQVAIGMHRKAQREMEVRA